jgi:hypothetical protein
MTDLLLVMGLDLNAKRTSGPWISPRFTLWPSSAMPSW